LLRRRMMQAAVAFGILAASTLGISSVANASPASFTAKAIHSDGAGALAVEVTGGLTWYNRSVGVTGIHLYLAPGECGTWEALGWQGSNLIAAKTFTTYKYCGGTTGKWIPFSDFTLDGSLYVGGIQSVWIIAIDNTHTVTGTVDCLRTASVCEVEN
jgi:hypothetical protein